MAQVILTNVPLIVCSNFLLTQMLLTLKYSDENRNANLANAGFSSKCRRSGTGNDLFRSLNFRVQVNASLCYSTNGGIYKL